MSDHDTEYMAGIICPHCGHEHDDSWEYFADGNETAEGIECEECEKEFNATVHVTIKYSTRVPA